MACMGPSKEFAEQQADKAFEEIMSLLKEKYGVHNWVTASHGYRHTDKQNNYIRNIWSKSSDEWDEKAAELKEALVELIWQQHYMDF